MLMIRLTPPKQKETSQLAALCEALSNRSVVSQQFNYDDIKRPAIFTLQSTYR